MSTSSRSADTGTGSPRSPKPLALATAGLIVLGKKESVSIKEEHHGVWPDEGPLAEWIKEKWSSAVFRDASRRPTEGEGAFSLRYLRLTQDSRSDLRDRLIELIDEFERRASVEAKLTKDLSEVSCLVALSPASLTDIRLKHSRERERNA